MCILEQNSCINMMGHFKGLSSRDSQTPSPNDGRERSVRKVRQNNMTLRMNATFFKVLREVLLGLFITESNVGRGNGIKRRRTGILKRILGRSVFTHFGCHAVYPRKRERKNHNQITRKERKRKDVCMKYE